MTYSLQHFLILSTILFSIGFVGICINRKSIISILLSVELMLLAVNINFVAFSHYLGDLTGQIFSIFILTIAAAESAIGLAIIVIHFRNRNTINVQDINELKG
jgi:NADH-quinone oxidoreductase subunit K